MARKDLLSEAIADAKAVKETALANAKLALEEAFTPKLQSMISARLSEEMDDEDELDDIDMEADDMEADDMEADDMEADDMEADDMEADDMEEDMHEEEYEEDMHEEEYEEDMHEEDEMDLDLESIIRELEGDVEEDMHEEEYEEDMHEEEYEEDEVSLDEIISALREMEEEQYEEDMHEEEDEMNGMAAELEEAYKTIKSLKKTINEVNLLNAKLLYTNKLFRTFDLNDSQKVKVLENFDRTSSVREVKLVFSTIAENLNVAKNKRTMVKEGYASKTLKSSAPKKRIINESDDLAARWKKLAGLK